MIINIITHRFQEILSQAPDQSSQVWAARHKTRGEDVAIKIVSTKKLNQKQLQTEVLALKRLNHPNIIKIYDVFESKSNAYLIMEK